MGVKVERLLRAADEDEVGSCNPRSRSIRLNTDLAKKPRECLEYIVVHEMVHLLEPTHNSRFIALMDRVHAQVAVLPGSAESSTRAARTMGLLRCPCKLNLTRCERP